jgi:hypothetical protein
MAVLWRHKERGLVYEILTDNAFLECSQTPALEVAFYTIAWTVYRNINTGGVWMRPTREFLDGRFERVSHD